MRGTSRVSLLVLIGLLAGAATPPGAVSANQMPAPRGAAPVVAPLPDGLLLEWNAPDPRIQLLENGEAEVLLPGFENTAAPGEWDVPQASVLVALPPSGDLEMEILSEVTVPAVLQGLPGRVPGRVAMVHGERIELETPERQEPQHAVAFDVLGTMRGVRLGRVTFTPLHETERGWQLTRSVKLQLHYAIPDAPAAATDDPIVEQIRRQVVNPGQLYASLTARGAESPYLLLSGETALVSVRSAGITAISYGALKNAGFPVDSANPHYLHLARGGVEAAMEWEGDGDAIFEPGEQLLFYADPRFSRWTDDDVYALRQEATPGSRIATRSGSPAGLASGIPQERLLVEKNVIYTPSLLARSIAPGFNGDRWAWDDIRWPFETSGQYAFNLASINPNPAGKLEIWLTGFTLAAANPDHKATIAINGTTLGTLEWDGKTTATGLFTVPTGTLRAGENQLTVTLPGPAGVPIDGILVDAFRLTYARGAGSWGNTAQLLGNASPRAYTAALTDTAGLRVYDVTQPEAPQKLTGFTVSGSQAVFGDSGAGGRSYALAAESGLQAPVSIRMAQALASHAGADYLIITHAAFRPALNPLMNHRTGQGLQTAVQDVQAIYDTYSGGRMDPEAIRAYLADAYAQWNPRPAFVLLVGDGTSDPRRYYESTPVTYLPPMLADVDPWAGEAAADNRYVTVDGDDPLPDMAIGRLPANTLAQAQAMVNKIVQHETTLDPGLWGSDITFVADKNDGSLRFAAMADRLSARLPVTAIAHRYLFDPKGVTDAQKEAERVWMRQAILDNWNAGTSVMIFAGHSSIHQWGEDILLHINQVSALSNAGRLPLLVELTCLTGAFQTPGFDVLDEALLRKPDGGVVAAWGSTGLGVMTGHEILASPLLQNLFAPEPTRLGEAILAAKLHLALSSTEEKAYYDLLDTYTLLGDPASIITTQANNRRNIYTPLIHR